MASIFSWFLAWESFPETVVNVMQALTSNGTVALCMVILFLFVLGLFVEGIPVLIVFAPILVPATGSLWD
ncbi:MAG: TRAP transporter large permease subunit [Enterocloster sp.]